MEEDLQQQLRIYAGARRKVRLTRSIPSETLHNGFIVDVGPDWVMLHQFHDFAREGYAVLRLADVTEIRSGEYERHWERMLESEGTLDRLVSPRDVRLDDLATLFKDLQRRGQCVIVECEDTALPLEDFYIGQILSVGARSLQFANFDALGQWDDVSHRIPFAEITKVQFDTPYANTFCKYLESPWRTPVRCD